MAAHVGTARPHGEAGRALLFPLRFGQTARAGLRLPDLERVAGANEDDVLGQARMRDQGRRQHDAAFLVGLHGAGVAEQRQHEIFVLLD